MINSNNNIDNNKWKNNIDIDNNSNNNIRKWPTICHSQTVILGFVGTFELNLLEPLLFN
jgi:hypothetical protein